jgi:hypothetical protein
LTEITEVTIDPAFSKPKHLHVRSTSPHGYDVLIGVHKVGVVMKEHSKGVVYTWGSERSDMPAPFSVKRMVDMKQELTRRISRDLYMSILETPGTADLPVTHVE